MSIIALSELAEESAGGGELEELRQQLVALRLSENPTGIEEAEEAALALERAIGAPPRLAEPAYLDRVGEATRRLEAALGSSAGSPFAQAMKQGLAAAEEALTLAPQTTQAYLAKANALLALERDQDVVAALQQAARTDPKNGEIQLELGDIYWRNLQDPDAAFERYRAATNLNPALAGAHVRLADYHLRRGDTNAAAPVLRSLRRSRASS